MIGAMVGCLQSMIGAMIGCHQSMIGAICHKINGRYIGHECIGSEFTPNYYYIIIVFKPTQIDC